MTMAVNTVSLAGKDTLDDFPEIWNSYYKKRDSNTRNKIVEYYTPLAKSLSAHYYKSRIGGQADYDDYFHNAIVGLIQAIEKYKPSKGAKFTTYASYRIKGQILNSISQLSEKNDQLSYVAKRKKELLNSLALSEKNDLELKSDLDEITEFTVNLTYSLLITESLTSENTEKIEELDAYTHFEMHDIVKTIKKLLNSIPGKLKLVLEYYYYYELNFLEIADIMGLTKGRVSQLHKEAIETLRAQYRKSLELNELF